MWFLLPLVVLALCVWWFWSTTKKVTGLSMQRIPKQAEDQLRPAKLSHADTERYISLYANVFRTQNLASVFSVMSDVFYHSVSNMIKGFNRLGIRKELDAALYPEEPDNLDYVFAVSFLGGGKTESSGAIAGCDYTERYVDSATGAVLYSAEKKQSYMGPVIIRSAVRDSAEKLYCTGCGAEIETGGEIFICKHCGASYRSDSFDWVMGNMVTPMGQLSGDTAIKRLITGSEIGGIILIILGFFAANSVFLKILIALGCAALVVITYFLTHSMLSATTAVAKLPIYDPLASSAVVGLRALYLTKRLYNAHDHNPGDMRTMMDAQGFDAFRGLAHSGNFVIDILAMQPVKSSDFYIRNGRQYLEYTYKAQLLVLTPRREMVTVEKVFKMVFYRNEHTRYEYMLRAESMKCSGCGMPLNLTAHGACKYCGIEYDVADFDWKVAYIDPAAFA